MREAIQQVIEGSAEVRVVGVAVDGDELWQLVVREKPDVVITDVRMPPSGEDEGIRIARRLRTEYPNIGLVVLSQYADPGYAIDLLASGAEGRAYLLKDRIHDRRELLSAIEVVAGAGSVIDPTIVRALVDAEVRGRESRLNDLTPRERDVLGELAQGKSNAAAADSLVLTKRAVEKHVGAIFQKLGLEDETDVSRRVMAVLLFLAARQSQSTRPRIAGYS